MHLVLGVAYGLGLHDLALELVGLEGFVYGTLDRVVFEHPIGGIQAALYFVFGYAGLKGLYQRGAELYLVEGFREGLAVDGAVHGVILGVYPGKHIAGGLGIVFPLEVDIAGYGVYGSVKAVGIAAGGGMRTACCNLKVPVQNRHICGSGYLAYAAAGLVLMVGAARYYGRGRLPAITEGAVSQYGIGGEFFAGLEHCAVYHAAGLLKIMAAVGVAALALVGGGGRASEEQALLELFYGNI